MKTNELRLNTTTVLALLLAWMLVYRRDDLNAAVDATNKFLRVPFGKKQSEEKAG